MKVTGKDLANWIPYLQAFNADQPEGKHFLTGDAPIRLDARGVLTQNHSMQAYAFKNLEEGFKASGLEGRVLHGGTNDYGHVNAMVEIYGLDTARVAPAPVTPEQRHELSEQLMRTADLFDELVKTLSPTTPYAQLPESVKKGLRSHLEIDPEIRVRAIDERIQANNRSSKPHHLELNQLDVFKLDQWQRSGSKDALPYGTTLESLTVQANKLRALAARVEDKTAPLNESEMRRASDVVPHSKYTLDYVVFLVGGNWPGQPADMRTPEQQALRARVGELKVQIKEQLPDRLDVPQALLSTMYEQAMGQQQAKVAAPKKPQMAEMPIAQPATEPTSLADKVAAKLPIIGNKVAVNRQTGEVVLKVPDAMGRTDIAKALGIDPKEAASWSRTTGHIVSIPIHQVVAAFEKEARQAAPAAKPAGKGSSLVEALIEKLPELNKPAYQAGKGNVFFTARVDDTEPGKVVLEVAGNMKRTEIAKALGIPADKAAKWGRTGVDGDIRHAVTIPADEIAAGLNQRREVDAPSGQENALYGLTPIAMKAEGLGNMRDDVKLGRGSNQGRRQGQ